MYFHSNRTDLPESPLPNSSISQKFRYFLSLITSFCSHAVSRGSPGEAVQGRGAAHLQVNLIIFKICIELYFFLSHVCIKCASRLLAL
jgi:hypothetical protein